MTDRVARAPHIRQASRGGARRKRKVMEREETETEEGIEEEIERKEEADRIGDEIGRTQIGADTIMETEIGEGTMTEIEIETGREIEIETGRETGIETGDRDRDKPKENITTTPAKEKEVDPKDLSEREREILKEFENQEKSNPYGYSAYVSREGEGERWRVDDRALTFFFPLSSSFYLSQQA